MTSQTWRLIEDEPGDGRVNMATDEAILLGCAEGESPPTLRLYGWQEPTLSVGYTQDLVAGVDLERCLDQGVRLVRRPTGGRALMHYRELTYSVTAPIPHPCFPSSLRGAFRTVSEALIRSLAKLGIDNAMMASGARVSSVKSVYRSPSCFVSANHCEIVVQGKKLIGSAQRRVRNAFLQHGSIWIESDRVWMNSLFRFDLLADREKDLEVLNQRTVTLNEILGRSVSFVEARMNFGLGFRESLAGAWEIGGLTAGERDRRESLLHSATVNL